MRPLSLCLWSLALTLALSPLAISQEPAPPPLPEPDAALTPVTEATPPPSFDDQGEADQPESDAAPEAEEQPEDDGGEPTVSLAVRERTITGQLSVIQEHLGATLIPRGAAAEQVIAEFRAQNLTLDELLQKFNTELGWQWYQDDTMDPNTYELYTDEDFRTMVLPRLVIEKSFYLENITAETAQGFVQEMLSEVGTVSAISRTNEIIVTDLPQYVEAVERLVEQIDVRLYIRVFRIRHANVEDIATALERLQSPDGTMEVDTRNHTIIVEDLFQNIRRMDLMVELLDVGTELQTYQLNYMSEDDMADLESALMDIVTPDAFLRVEYRTGQIILQDIPEVQQRAAEIIAAYDQPTRQIMLQADVVQVTTNRNFSLDTEFAISGDLLAAGADDLVDLPFPGSSSSGGQGGSTTTNEFTNLRDEFPVFVADGTGISLDYLSTHIRAQLTASIQSGNSQLLLSPRIQVKDKEPATIDVGGEVPFLTTINYNNSNDGRSSVQQQAVREGLLLEVTPFITNTGYVELQVRIENNDADVDTRTYAGEPYDVVERATQQVETVLIVPDGATRVIAGLLNSSNSETHNGIPYLSDMPYVGWLFGTQRDNRSRDNLMIFLTPNIIVESAGDYEWSPTYDERPVGSRFRTPRPAEPEPVRPADVDLLMPLLAPEAAEEGSEEGAELPTLAEAPVFELPRSSALSDVASLEEPIPVPPLRGPEEMTETEGVGQPLMELPEAEAPPESDTLPLVDIDLRPSTGEAGSGELLGPRTSFSGDRPRVAGSMLSSGGAGSEGGGANILGGGSSGGGGGSRATRTTRTGRTSSPGDETEFRGSRSRSSRGSRTSRSSDTSERGGQSGVVDYSDQGSDRDSR